jgi:hypothetical protein
MTKPLRGAEILAQSLARLGCRRVFTLSGNHTCQSLMRRSRPISTHEHQDAIGESLTEHLLRNVIRHPLRRSRCLDGFDMRLAVQPLQLCDKQVSRLFDDLSHLVKHHMGRALQLPRTRPPRPRPLRILLHADRQAPPGIGPRGRALMHIP